MTNTIDITKLEGRPELTGQEHGDLPEVSVSKASALASGKVMPHSKSPSGCDGPSNTQTTHGRLRAYGNALCASQAQGFIEAYMEGML